MFAIRATVTLVTKSGSKVGVQLRSSTPPKEQTCEVGPACRWVVLGALASGQHDHTSKMADVGGGQEYLHVWLLWKAPFQSSPSVYLHVSFCWFSQIRLQLNTSPQRLQQVAVQLASFSNLQSCCRKEEELCGAFFNVFSVISTRSTLWSVD